MELKIEKGVPMPSRRDRLNGVVAELQKMKPTESVVLPCCKATAWQKAKEAFGLGNFKAKGEKNGTRIWRVR